TAWMILRNGKYCSAISQEMVTARLAERHDEQHGAAPPEFLACLIKGETMTRTTSDSICELRIAGFALQSMTKEKLNATLTQQLKANRACMLFFANTNFIVKCQNLREQITEANSIVVNDGIGVDVAGWVIHQCSLPENLNGTDFIPQFLAVVKNDTRVFLFGGKPGIAARAANALYVKGINVVGTADGYGGRDAKTVVEE